MGVTQLTARIRWRTPSIFHAIYPVDSAGGDGYGLLSVLATVFLYLPIWLVTVPLGILVGGSSGVLLGFVWERASERREEMDV